MATNKWTIGALALLPGFYEGFWGLGANVIVVAVLNPIFLHKRQENAVTENLFGTLIVNSAAKLKKKTAHQG